jgi:hypothetical protein
LLDQFEMQPDAIREEPFSAAHDHWTDNHLQLVNQPRPYCM